MSSYKYSHTLSVEQAAKPVSLVTESTDHLC